MLPQIERAAFSTFSEQLPWRLGLLVGGVSTVLSAYTIEHLFIFIGRHPRHVPITKNSTVSLSARWGMPRTEHMTPEY